MLVDAEMRTALRVSSSAQNKAMMAGSSRSKGKLSSGHSTRAEARALRAKMRVDCLPVVHARIHAPLSESPLLFEDEFANRVELVNPTERPEVLPWVGPALDAPPPSPETTLAGDMGGMDCVDCSMRLKRL